MGLCRLCASLQKAELLIHIKDQSNEICQKLEKCCRISIHMSDAMPKSVCLSCFGQLNVAYNFYSKVQKAQETLKALFLNKQAEERSGHVSSCGDNSPSEDTATHSSKQNTIEIIIDPTRHHKEELQIKTEMGDVDTQVPLEPIFLSRQMDQRNENKAGSGGDYSIKEIANRFTSNQSTTAGREEITECQKKSPCTIKIEEEDIEHLKQEANTDHDGMTTIANVSVTEDACHGDSDGYLPEDYSISGMPDDVNQEPTAEENESMDFVVTTIVKEEEVMQEEQTGIFLETTKANMSLELNYVELEEDISQNEDRNEYPLLPNEMQLTSWKSYKHLCYACNYTASSFEDLMIHAYAMHSISDKNNLHYKCYDCLKVIEHYNDFLNHVRLKHHPALKLRCDACDMLSTDYKQHELHRNVSCLEAEKYPNNLECSYCSKTFRTLEKKQLHIRQHAEDYPEIKFECKDCHKEFLSKRSLHLHEKIHKNSHADKKLYRCLICHKDFNIERYLVKHQIIHTDKKPFKCSFCPRQFRTKIEQTNHERVHTGEMPFQCSHCEKRFRFRSALSAHLNTHSGIRAHTCKYCSRQFKDRSNLKKHIIFKHAEEESNEII